MQVKYLFLKIILILILSFWTFRPLFTKGLFPIHDDTQVARVIEMKKALKDGHLPVRWSADLGYGYGYPLFNFYAPLPYYFGGLIDYFFENPILATKLMYLLGILLAGVSMFVLMREFAGELAGITSAILYLYAPYHAVEIYVRGSVSEYWTYGLLPVVLFGIYRALKTKKIYWIVSAGISISLLILSHNIISLLSIVFLILTALSLAIYNLVFRNNFRAIYPLFFSILIGLSLSAFFFLPAIFESQHTNVSSIIEGGSDFKDHFVFLDQLWDSPWGFAGSSPGRTDGMSFKLGKIQVILGFSGLILVYWLKFKKKISTFNFRFIQIVILLTFISLFMVINQSLFIWNLSGRILKFVQFPWRFLVFITFGLSFLAGFLFKTLEGKLKYLLGSVVVFITIFYNAKYFQPQSFLTLTNRDYQKEDYLKWTVSKISDEYLPKEFVKPEDKSQIAQEVLPYGTYYQLLEKKTDKLRFFLNQDFDRQLSLNLTYFPAWAAYVDGREVEVKESHGLVSIFVPAGFHEVVILLRNTIIQTIGNSLTVVTILLILCLIFLLM